MDAEATAAFHLTREVSPRLLHFSTFYRWKWPCVDGPPLASGFWMMQLLVGAAMCPACDAALSCAAGHDAFRADRVPTNFSHSECTGQNRFS